MAQRKSLKFIFIRARVCISNEDIIFSYKAIKAIIVIIVIPHKKNNVNIPSIITFLLIALVAFGFLATCCVEKT
jgi:hypothetical protein